jgi:23S rRNA (pseudouridine1915-N3)-methyltransferase
VRVTLIAVGRLRAGPEADLVDDYLQRFERTGRSRGLGPVRMIEVEDKRGGGARAEAALIEGALPRGSRMVALDERGATMSSGDFADALSAWSESGVRDLTFVIGGADGLTPSLRGRANRVLSFGPMVWPHLLARVMLAEQLYRAATILAGSPYHRV